MSVAALEVVLLTPVLSVKQFSTMLLKVLPERGLWLVGAYKNILHSHSYSLRLMYMDIKNCQINTATHPLPPGHPTNPGCNLGKTVVKRLERKCTWDCVLVYTHKPCVFPHCEVVMCFYGTSTTITTIFPSPSAGVSLDNKKGILFLFNY